MLERVWRKGDPPTLLLGVQTGVAATENSKEVPQNIKNRTLIFFRLLKYTKHFEIIINSHAVVCNNRIPMYPLPSFPQWKPLCQLEYWLESSYHLQ